MCRSSFKYNLTFIVLFFGITLIHAGDEGEETSTNDIKLYYTEWSVPCRSVMMIGKMLDIPFEMIELDLKKRDRYDSEYENINPLRKAPVINDNGFILWESRAIMVYLVQKYGANHQLNLYPANLQIQANINKMLQFDMGTLTLAFNNLYGMWALYKSPKTEYKQTKLLDAFQIFDTLLENQFAAGNSLTLADVALFVNIITIEAAGEINLNEYKNINFWYTKCNTLLTNYKNVNTIGLNIIRQKTEDRKKEDKDEMVEGLVYNSDFLKAISTLVRGVQSQVISSEYLYHFKSLETRLLLLR
ncbi:hypothetical protein QTP88_003004 [Uroleucon formosanum]